jgi:hypothetical protein
LRAKYESHQPIGTISPEYPKGYGYCSCGCGEKTQKSIQNSSDGKYLKGQHFRFIRHHSSRLPNRTPGCGGRPVKTQETVISEFKAIHGDRYNYDKFIYTGCDELRIITCGIHGDFLQSARCHQEHGCRKCANAGRTRKCSNTEKFIEKSKLVHGDTYNYSKVDYKRSNQKVEIICSIHGSFWLAPSEHTSSEKGCPKCGWDKRRVVAKATRNTIEDFISKSKLKHGDKYDYSKSIYITSKDKIEIICPRHGSYWQVTSYHLDGYGCPKCAGQGITKGHQQVLDFILSKYPGINMLSNDRATIFNQATNRCLELDVWIPSLNLAFEYDGEYWHGLPRSIDQDSIKDSLCKEYGITLIRIPESDWKKQREVVSSAITSAISPDPIQGQYSLFYIEPKAA